MSISDIYSQILNDLKVNLNSQVLREAKECSLNLLTLFGDDDVSQKTVLLAYGGGKDSSFAVAFIRLVQIIIFDKEKKTFTLRVITNRHSGVLKPVLNNIDRVYKKLRMYNDPYVELLLADGDDISAFDTNKPIAISVLNRNRKDILMTGHLCHGEARPTFCNACNMNMVKSFRLAIEFNDNFADVIVTGDSKKELVNYYKWMRKVSRGFQIEQNIEKNFSVILRTLDEIADCYFGKIYGSLPVNKNSAPKIKSGIILYSIYDFTSYEAGAHWEFLVSYLGFEFDELSFNFTETDCFNPALMAHIRGLRSDHLEGQTYDKGLREYLDFAFSLMALKQIPESLIDIMRDRYKVSENILMVNKRISEYTKSALDITENQLICMVYSPFASEGKFLAKYLREQCPSLFSNLEILHYTLSGQIELNQTNQIVWKQIEELSGLSLEEARQLYKSRLVNLLGDLPTDNSEDVDPVKLLLNNDPHKAIVKTKTPDGKHEERLISGR